MLREDRPEWAVVLERQDKGRFYGFPTGILIDGQEATGDPAEIWQKFNTVHSEVRGRWRQEVRLQTDDIGALSRADDDARLAINQAIVDYGRDDAPNIARRSNAKPN